MSGVEAAALVAEDSAATHYVKTKTSVWWDIENCRVPRGCDPYAIARNITSALSKMKYCGQVSISAYGDTNQIPNDVQQALSSTGISLNHVPAGVKDASDKKILVDMLFWAVDNPAPATYLLISGDRDFSNALHQLRMRRYDILLAQPTEASAALVSAAKTAWLWTSLVAGGGPITKSEMGVTLEEPAKKDDQQVQLSGSKRPPPPSKSEKKSSCARTQTTQNASTQCSDKKKNPIQKRPPPPSKSEKKSSCARTQTTQNGFTQCSVKKKNPIQKRPPPPSKSEKKSSCARTETTQNGSTQWPFFRKKNPIQCYNCAGGHFSRNCTKEKRTCFICGEEGHMHSFCKQVGPKPAQSQQESASCNNNTPIAPDSEQSMKQKKQKCFNGKEEGHMLASSPQKSGLMPAQSQSVSATSYNLPINDPIEPASEQYTELNKQRCYICKKEGHMVLSCPQGVPSRAQSQQDSASYNNLPCKNSEGPPFEKFATQNTGAPIALSSPQQWYNVGERNAPFAQGPELQPSMVEVQYATLKQFIDAAYHQEVYLEASKEELKVCYNCGEKGHIKQQCSKPQRTCHRCWAQGHIQKYCPQNWGAGHTQQTSVNQNGHA